MIKNIVVALAFLAAGSVSAGAQEDDTVEEMASAEEAQKVNETLAKIGCTAPAIEKESETLYEIDDATCEIGQYDIKLNGDFKIVVMSLDE
ncbi:hypothetical protein [Jiella marina]|uniref:hypothetical protein n=1 Tax=Jiella sp. LLJ827 TaxID=2917712 RepID=UPI0021019670|nr:hypothetical protein [Jiella sp. LLJ827]MCQ0987638.1 hypothetical protein [Jiella sp. LLJ827]